MYKTMKKNFLRAMYLSALGLLLPAKAVYADVPLGLFVLINIVFALPVMGVVIIIEAILLHFFFEMSWKKAALASLVVNIASAIVGLLAVISVEFRLLMSHLLSLPPTIEELATLAFIAFLDCLIELPCIRFIFKAHLSAKRIMIFFFGNAVTGFLVILFVY
jgi:hypothetical protein